jgi:putative iron-only hydrogenase system regulator
VLLGASTAASVGLPRRTCTARGPSLEAADGAGYDTSTYCDLIHGSFPVEKRLGTISIIVERQRAPVATVNELLSQFGDCLLARLGLPFSDRGVNIITLVTDTSVERLSALTGKLGKLPGVQVKSMMAKPLEEGVARDDPPDD